MVRGHLDVDSLDADLARFGSDLHVAVAGECDRGEDYHGWPPANLAIALRSERMLGQPTRRAEETGRIRFASTFRRETFNDDLKQTSMMILSK